MDVCYEGLELHKQDQYYFEIMDAKIQKQDQETSKLPVGNLVEQVACSPTGKAFSEPFGNFVKHVVCDPMTRVSQYISCESQIFETLMASDHVKGGYHKTRKKDPDPLTKNIIKQVTYCSLSRSIKQMERVSDLQVQPGLSKQNNQEPKPTRTLDPLEVWPPKTLEEHKISNDDLSNFSGSESVVYEAILDSWNVAAKKPILPTSDDLDKFHRHLQLLCNLDHPSVAKLLAAHEKPPNYMFFFELYESGTLAEKLHIEEWSPSIYQVLMIMLHLAKALQYLHNNRIVHMEVKPANVLLDERYLPYLADFGLEEHKKNLCQVNLQNWRSSGKLTGGFHKKNMVRTLIYMAPEKKEMYTENSDIYSFRILINELLTGVVPYTDLRAEAQDHSVLEMNYTEQQLTAAFVSSGMRPTLAETGLNLLKSLLSLIQKCWEDDPSKRPSLDNVVLEQERGKQHSHLLEKTSNYKNDRDGDSITNTGDYRDTINWSSQGECFSKKASLSTVSNVKFWSTSTDDPSSYISIISCGSFATCGKRESREEIRLCGKRKVSGCKLQLE